MTDMTSISKATRESPLANGGTATMAGCRDQHGRFSANNKAASGRRHPHAARVASLRKSMLAAVRLSDIKAIMQKLVEMAKAGDIHAAREVLSRTLGDPIPADLEQRLADVEVLLNSEDELL